jgi:hypothetical protein
MKLRGHHLLCILGFRGRGYSAQHVANMAALVEQLRSLPLLPVQVIDSPDDICSHCPYLEKGACAQKGASSELRVASRDLRLLFRLGLLPSARFPWLEIQRRIVGAVVPQDLETLCRGCQWLSRGYCREGLQRLSTSGSFKRS